MSAGSVSSPLSPAQQYYSNMQYGSPSQYGEGMMAASAQPTVTSIQVHPPMSMPVASLVPPPALTESVSTVKAAWEKYFNAFITKDVERVLACYDESSHVRSFNNIDAIKSDYVGLEGVRKLYQDLFNDLSIDVADFSTFEISVADIDEDAGQVFMAWRCPGSGILAATSTFIYARNLLIWKQNTVTSKVPRPGQLPSDVPVRAAAPTPLAPPATPCAPPAAITTNVPLQVQPGVELPPINISPSVKVTVSEPVPFKSLSGNDLLEAMAELQKLQVA